MPSASEARIKVEREGSDYRHHKLVCDQPFASGSCDRTLAINGNISCPRCKKEVSLVQLVKAYISSAMGARTRQEVIREIKTHRFDPDTAENLRGLGWWIVEIPEGFCIENMRYYVEREYFDLGEVNFRAPVGCFDSEFKVTTPTEVAWKPGLEVKLQQVTPQWDVTGVLPGGWLDPSQGWTRPEVASPFSLIYLLLDYYVRHGSQFPSYQLPILTSYRDKHRDTHGESSQFLLSANSYGKRSEKDLWAEIEIRKVPAKLIAFETWRPTVPASVVSVTYPRSLYSG